MRRVVGVVAGCAIAFATSLLLARTHPFGDAGLHGGTSGRSRLLENSSVPPEVRATLVVKCADCHSMQTRSPAYGRFAPVSWLMEKDIVEGRKAMNLSLWDSYSVDQRQIFAAKIAQQTKAGKMPLLQYRMIHRNAELSSSEVQAFDQWARAAMSGGAESGAASGVGDAGRGKSVFERRCSGCHAMTQTREGPPLQGVYGRAAGTAPGFSYSAALKKTHMVWNDESLERWLAGPDELVPGNDMDFRVAKTQERLDLIRFLKDGSRL